MVQGETRLQFTLLICDSLQDNSTRFFVLFLSCLLHVYVDSNVQSRRKRGVAVFLVKQVPLVALHRTAEI